MPVTTVPVEILALDEHHSTAPRHNHKLRIKSRLAILLPYLTTLEAEVVVNHLSQHPKGSPLEVRIKNGPNFSKK